MFCNPSCCCCCCCASGIPCVPLWKLAGLENAGPNLGGVDVDLGVTLPSLTPVAISAPAASFPSSVSVPASVVEGTVPPVEPPVEPPVDPPVDPPLVLPLLFLFSSLLLLFSSSVYLL